MRPYRGKTKEGKWVKGWYYHNPFVDIHSIFWAIDHSTFDLKHVIPETVGQSTGLKDSKRTEEYPEGQEIFEGDIVHIWSKFYEKDMPIATVYWNKKLAAFDVKESKGHYHNWLRNGHKKGWFIEVIGTIWDDKEQE